MKYESPKIIDLKGLSDAGAGDEPSGCDVGKGVEFPACSNGTCNNVGCSVGTFPGHARVGACVSGNSPDVAHCCSGSGPTTGCGMSPV